MKLRVTIMPRSGGPGVEFRLDLSGEQLHDQVIGPYEEGKPVVIGGRTFQPEEVERITISAARSAARWRPHARRKKEESEKPPG